MAKTRTPTIKELTNKLARMGFKQSKENVQLKLRPVLYDTLSIYSDYVHAETVKESKPKFKAGKKI